MVKGSDSVKESKFSTIIGLKTDIQKIKDEKNTWEKDDIERVGKGLIQFIIYILEFYQKNKNK